MASHKNYEEKAEQLLAPIAEANDVWIYDVEYVKEAGTYYLRGYIEKDEGVSIIDCENVSRAWSDSLDAAEAEGFVIDSEYILEVSSPGLGRQLKKDRHLENSIGLDVDIKLFEAVDGQKEYTGELVSYDKNILTISVNEQPKSFDRAKIANIRLTLDI